MNRCASCVASSCTKSPSYKQSNYTTTISTPSESTGYLLASPATGGLCRVTLPPLSQYHNLFQRPPQSFCCSENDACVKKFTNPACIYMPGICAEPGRLHAISPLAITTHHIGSSNKRDHISGQEAISIYKVWVSRYHCSSSIHALLLHRDFVHRNLLVIFLYWLLKYCTNCTTLDRVSSSNCSSGGPRTCCRMGRSWAVWLIMTELLAWSGDTLALLSIMKDLGSKGTYKAQQSSRTPRYSPRSPHGAAAA